MVYIFETTENKNDLVGAEVISEMKEEGTGNKGFLLRKPCGEEVILSSKEMFISDNVRKATDK